MKDFYVIITADGSSHGREHTPGDFYVPTPWLQSLEGDWEFALVELSMECEFSPKLDIVYLCSDIVEQSYIGQVPHNVLRNIGVRGRYNKYLTERYMDPRYVGLRTGWKQDAHFQMLDDQGQSLNFTSKKLHGVLHVRQRQ
jgi:hypothetical protein